MQDEKTRDAVAKCIEAVGTAARNLMSVTPGLERDNPGLALRKAYATRIRLARVYDHIDPDLLWTTATESLPAIVASAREALRSASDET